MEQIHGSWEAVGFSLIWSALPFLADQENELKGDIDLEAVVNQIYQASEYPRLLLQVNCPK